MDYRTKLRAIAGLIISVILLFFVSIFSTLSFDKKSKFISPISTLSASTSASKSVTPTLVPTQKPKPKTSSLTSVIQSSLTGTTGKYSVVVKNLKTGETFYKDEHAVFEPASLYKLWVMAVAYKQIEAGTLQKNQVLSESISVLNDKFKIASEAAEKREGTVTFTVEDALSRMITLSDNYAAMLLSQRIRLSNVTVFLEDNGFSDSLIGSGKSNPAASAYDIALFLEKLYNGEFANEQYTNEMIALLKNQRLNGKLPKDLPKEVVIAHKTGELRRYSHDAGIVYTQTGNYIIVVLTESDVPAVAVKRISEVSKNVYHYFME